MLRTFILKTQIFVAETKSDIPPKNSEVLYVSENVWGDEMLGGQGHKMLTGEQGVGGKRQSAQRMRTKGRGVMGLVTHLGRNVEGLSSGSVAERVRNRNFRRFTRKEEEKRRGRGLHKCLLNEISVVTRTSDPHSHMQRTSPPTSKQDAAHHYCTSS